MAYRRRQGISRASTFKEEIHHPSEDDDDDKNNKNNQNDGKTFASSRSFTASASLPASPLAGHAIRGSASRKIHSPVFPEDSDFDASRSKGFNAYEDARNDSKGFWGVLARKAKAILDDDNMTTSQQSETSSPRVGSSSYMSNDASSTPSQGSDHQGGFRRMDNPALRRGLDKLNASLNQIGDTFDKAFEEGRTIVESKTHDIIQETRKLQIRRKEGSNPMDLNQVTGVYTPPAQANHDTQLKASRDVAMATAAKAKVLLRELKTVKADLAFAKARCSQLEEENKLLRESRDTGGNPADDDLIRLQLETLLAEKARLAHENSVYARENRFLREVVEYHQLTMQDVVYLDDGAEEMTEVYPINLPYSKLFSDDSPTSPKSPPSPSGLTPPASPSPPPPPPPSTTTKQTLTLQQQQQQEKPKAKDVDVPTTPTSATPTPLPNKDEDAIRPPISSA